MSNTFPMKNTDPFARWNDPMDRNDPFKPWNSPLYQDDPFAPWNHVFGDERDYRRYCDEHDIPERDR